MRWGAVLFGLAVVVALIAILLPAGMPWRLYLNDSIVSEGPGGAPGDFELGSSISSGSLTQWEIRRRKEDSLIHRCLIRLLGEDPWVDYTNREMEAVTVGGENWWVLRRSPRTPEEFRESLKQR